MKIRITKDGVVNTIKTGFSFAAAVAVVVLPNLSTLKEVADDMRYRGKVTYNDAIDAILHSTIYSSDKTKLVMMLPKDRDVEFYKSIVSILNSTIYSGDKFTIIKDICEREEES